MLYKFPFFLVETHTMHHNDRIVRSIDPTIKNMLISLATTIKKILTLYGMVLSKDNPLAAD